MLELPFEDPTDPLKLADWLELYALLAPDRNSSRGDLESALRLAAFAETRNSEEIERKTLEVFYELEQRKVAAGEAYPFDLDHFGTIQLRSKWQDFPVYTFCLCLSYFGLNETNLAPKLFEQVSCQAAKGYLRGNAIGFGWPRIELPASFPDAITEMCRLVGEGEGYRQQSSLNRKDDTLDLVAWKDFVDKRPSKILMFGQCASGKHWEEKLAELQPKVFWGQWMQVQSVSPTPMQSFFIPHRVGRDKWEWVARKAGVLFDRCRIAFWAHAENENYDPFLKWCGNLLEAAL
jgi:hypothetical protein